MGFDVTLFLDHATRLAVAAVLGGVIGLEREWKGHWAGLRTHMMVALGAALFLLVGTIAVKGETAPMARIIQGIAEGVGFLGAGAILKLSEQREIRGLTTASSIWLAAALGAAAGLGAYALATAAICVSIFILAILLPVEKYFQSRVHVKQQEQGDRTSEHTEK
ncbi:MAG TPA: MgtC/SapB family protein [Lacipirellulaceae bacterium]|nr:MgtC/SapB family protein [Lacipirellulaceae bacterium]